MIIRYLPCSDRDIILFQAVIRFFIHAANPPTLAPAGRRRIISRKGDLYHPLETPVIGNCHGLFSGSRSSWIMSPSAASPATASSPSGSSGARRPSSLSCPGRRTSGQCSDLTEAWGQSVIICLSSGSAVTSAGACCWTTGTSPRRPTACTGPSWARSRWSWASTTPRTGRGSPSSQRRTKWRASSYIQISGDHWHLGI